MDNYSCWIRMGVNRYMILRIRKHWVFLKCEVCALYCLPNQPGNSEHYHKALIDKLSRIVSENEGETVN